MRSLRFSRWNLLSLALLATLVSGCLPGVSWLPDSSGFVFTEGDHFRQLCLYDVAKGVKRVVVADTTAATNWPALSPDGEQLALTRLQKQADGTAMVQVIVYDLQGKELHRSPETAWRAAEPNSPGGEPSMAGAHWSRDGKKLVIHDYHDKKPQSAIYEPGTQKFKIIEGTPSIIGGTPVRPDGKTFLLARLSGDESIDLVTVDWEGKEQAIALEPEVADDKEKRVLLVYPSFGSSRWDGSTATISFGTWQFRLDTEKHLGTFANLPTAEAMVGDRQIVQQHKFSTGAGARVLKEKDPGDNSGEKYRLELLVAGVKEPMLFIEKSDGMFLFAPSPDGKRLAIRYTTGRQENKERIIVIDAKGQIERTMEVEQ